jgi:eukaryotic-like serine/threonine-protein kinase
MSPRFTQPLAPGRTLAPGYEVVEHLRRGHRLDVYDVWSIERQARCIAKTAIPERAVEPLTRRRLLTEGRLLARLTHPNLVRAYGIVEAIEQPRPVVILETLTGETLDRVIHLRANRLPLGDVVVLGLQLTSAIGYLHRHGWLHLDLKPANIVVEAGQARVLDLSLARRPGRGRPGSGTRGYMAPEQAVGGWLSPETDTWGIGTVLYEALTGREPFEDVLVSSSVEGGPRRSLAERHPETVIRAPSVRRFRRLPSDLAALVDACLEPIPTRRPSIAHLSARLTEISGIDPRATDVADTGEQECVDQPEAARVA